MNDQIVGLVGEERTLLESLLQGPGTHIDPWGGRPELAIPIPIY